MMDIDIKNEISRELESQIQKILIVDDTKQNLYSVSNIIASLDAEVMTAESAKEGLALLLQYDISIAIIDVQMPEMNGFEMAKLMQEHEKTKYIPIIFVTALSNETSYAYKGYLAGAVDYMFVPLDPNILRSKLKIFLGIQRRQNELQQALDNVSKITRQYQKVLDSVSEGILGLTEKGTISFANPAAGKLLKCDNDKLIGKHFISLMNPPDEQDVIEMWQVSPIRKAFNKEQTTRFLDSRFWCMDGTSFPVEYSCSAMRFEEESSSGHVLVFQDITERKVAEERLMKLANYDSLTGCLNRNFFFKLLRQSISKAKRNNEYLAVLFFDLNKFKQINDMYGHAFGDKVLKNVSGRIQDCIREEDLFARYGGDEFALLLGDVKNEQSVYAITKKIHDSLSEHFIIDDYEIFVATSIGLALYPQDAESAEELIKRADMAMYEAKVSPDIQTLHYDVSMERKLSDITHTQIALKNAIHNNEFSLKFQLYYESEKLNPVGAESLLRWNNHNFSHMNVEEMINKLEEFGLIIDVGRWVLEESCYTAKEWQDLGLVNDTFKISVNVSLLQIMNGDFIDTVKSVLEITNINPDIIQLEFTESIFMDNPYHVIALCNDLYELGVHVVIDDFGTGYSSLAYLMQLKISKIKIDKYFVSQIGKTDNAAKIINATINLAHSLNLGVVAEGVEYDDQLQLLRGYNCDYLQGYLMARPEDRELVKSLLIKNRASLR